MKEKKPQILKIKLTVHGKFSQFLEQLYFCWQLKQGREIPTACCYALVQEGEPISFLPHYIHPASFSDAIGLSKGSGANSRISVLRWR